MTQRENTRDEEAAGDEGPQLIAVNAAREKGGNKGPGGSVDGQVDYTKIVKTDVGKWKSIYEMRNVQECQSRLTALQHYPSPISCE